MRTRENFEEPTNTYVLNPRKSSDAKILAGLGEIDPNELPEKKVEQAKRRIAVLDQAIDIISNTKLLDMVDDRHVAADLLFMVEDWQSIKSYIQTINTEGDRHLAREVKSMLEIVDEREAQTKDFFPKLESLKLKALSAADEAVQIHEEPYSADGIDSNSADGADPKDPNSQQFGDDDN